MPDTNAEVPSYGIVHTTLDGIILTCDDAYADFLGVGRYEATGRRVADFTADIGSGGPETMISILVRTGEPMSVRRTFIRPDGSECKCTFQLCLIRDMAGAPHSVIAVGQRVPPPAT